VLIVLPTDKRNAAVVLGTSDDNHKIATILKDKAYKKLEKDPMDSVECKTGLLKIPGLLKVFANYDHRVKGPLDFKNCRRSRL
jgi:hypothetical protein